MMKRTSITSSYLVTALASLLLLNGCKSDPEVPPVAVQQAAVLFVHGDNQLAGSKIQFALDDVNAGELSYGQGGSYLTFATGAHTVKMTGGSITNTSPVRLDADKVYSYFAAPSAAAATIGNRVVNDDLTRPAAGRARIRLISLLANAGSGIELVQPSSSAANQHVAFDADAFGDFTPVNTNLAVLSGTGQVLAQVGSGTGAGTGARRYEDGHIYTIVAVGDPTATNPDARPRAYVLTNL